MTHQLHPRFAPSSLILTGPNATVKLLQIVNRVFRTVDQLHVVPKLVPVTFNGTRRRREQGSYDPRGPQISVSCYAEDWPGTILHEFGHFLDNRILHAVYRDYASRYDPDFVALIEACEGSLPIKQARRILHAYGDRLTASDRNFLKESLEPHEMFARAYLQWVCTRTDDVMLHNVLVKRLEYRPAFAGISCTFQWGPAEFKGIMAPMDELFVAKGLLCP